MTHYNKIADQYIKRRKDKSRFDYNRDIEVPALIKMIGDVKGKTILDVGCGFGDHAQKLSQKKFKKRIAQNNPRRIRTKNLDAACSIPEM